MILAVFHNPHAKGDTRDHRSFKDRAEFQTWLDGTIGSKMKDIVAVDGVSLQVTVETKIVATVVELASAH